MVWIILWIDFLFFLLLLNVIDIRKKWYNFWSVNDNNKKYYANIMIYYSNEFKLNNTNYPRFLFSDIFISKNTIGIISIIYPDVSINLKDIKCIINIDNPIEFRFDKSIIHTKVLLRQKYCSELKLVAIPLWKKSLHTSFFTMS